MTANVTSVDVVLAHHNGSRFIAEQIESVLAAGRLARVQVRMIIVDDASSSDELKKVEDICQKIPNAELYRSKKNLGVVRAFEFGLMKTSSPYVMCCDQDDFWSQQKIEASIKKLNDSAGHHPGLTFTDLEIVDEDLNTVRPRMLNLASFDQMRDRSRLMFQNVVAGCTIIVNRKLLDLALPFPAGIPMHDHWLAACAAYGGRIEMVNRPLIKYRQHGNNVVGSSKHRLLKSIINFPATLRELDRSLESKSRLCNLVADRVTNPEAKAELYRLANAFSSRSLKNLRYLISKNVFQMDYLRNLLMMFAYLVRPKSKV